MSQENVERIRRGHEALERAGFGVEEWNRLMADLLHPDVEWHDQRELPGATVHHGIEGVRRHTEASQEALHYESADLLEVVDAGPCVVAAYRVHARGRASGVRVERDSVYVFTFRAEKVERVQIFGSMSEALEAAGRRVIQGRAVPGEL